MKHHLIVVYIFLFLFNNLVFSQGSSQDMMNSAQQSSANLARTMQTQADQSAKVAQDMEEAVLKSKEYLATSEKELQKAIQKEQDAAKTAKSASEQALIAQADADVTQNAAFEANKKVKELSQKVSQTTTSINPPQSDQERQTEEAHTKHGTAEMTAYNLGQQVAEASAIAAQKAEAAFTAAATSAAAQSKAAQAHSQSAQAAKEAAIAAATVKSTKATLAATEQAATAAKSAAEAMGQASKAANDAANAFK